MCGKISIFGNRILKAQITYEDLRLVLKYNKSKSPCTSTIQLGIMCLSDNCFSYDTFVCLCEFVCQMYCSDYTDWIPICIQLNG